jgi:hypothetical protein
MKPTRRKEMNHRFTVKAFCVLPALLALSASLLCVQSQETTPTQQNPQAAAASSARGAPAAGDAVTAKPVPDAAFRGVKLADAKGKQTDAALIFSDTKQTVSVRVADRDFVSVPYGQLDKFSYEYTKKHRVTQGAVVMVASLGAGAIVMLTKSKSHWLYMDFREQNVPRSLVLRMDKREYKNILEALKTHTGKEVEFLNDAASGSKKDKDEQDVKND